MQQHVGSAVADFGVRISRQTVEQFGNILGGFIGGLVFMGSDCADGRNNGSINGADIVEGDAGHFLDFLDSGRVEGI